jgi:antitoxin PrlF
MSSHFSRITKKFQVTVPFAIRQKLGLKSGDIIHFELRDLDLAFLQALEGQLTEWHSEADEDAYRVL